MGETTAVSERSRAPQGRFNAEKCVKYLRHIGVEVSEEQKQYWLDAQSVHRFIGSTRKPSRTGKRFGCNRGHHWIATFWHHGDGMRAHNATICECPECGESASAISLQWVRAKDGSFKDYRPHSERWRPTE